MSSVYPRAATPKAVEAIDPATCAERVIAAREADPCVSKERAVGQVLQGSDDLRTFYRVWGEVEAERLAMTTVYVADYDTLTKFKAALSVEAYYLDVVAWVDGLEREAGVGTWSELKALADDAAALAAGEL